MLLLIFTTVKNICAKQLILFSLAERFNQLLAQSTFCKFIECSVDRLMRDLFGEIIRIHPLQSASNLLWRPPNSDQGLDYLQDRLWSKLYSTNRSLFSRISSSVMMTALSSIERWWYCLLIVTPYTLGVTLVIRN